MRLRTSASAAIGTIAASASPTRPAVMGKTLRHAREAGVKRVVAAP
jgi:hypothetical protein